MLKTIWNKKVILKNKTKLNWQGITNNSWGRTYETMAIYGLQLALENMSRCECHFNRIYYLKASNKNNWQIYIESRH